MRTRRKLALIAVGATLLIALAVGTASARNLSISNQNVRVTFNNVEIADEGLGTTTCHVTLEGSLHSRTIAKTPETLLGFITRVTTGSCNNPLTILAATLPWHVRYVGFSGTLPDITLLIVKIFNVSFQREPGLGIRCLDRGNLTLRFIRNITTGELTGTEIPPQSLPLTGSFCPSESLLRSNGNGNVTLLGAATRLTLTLI